MSRIRRVLHPTDLSGASTAAYRHAVKIAKADGAELLLVHFITPVALTSPARGVSPRSREELRVFARANAQRRLDALVAMAKDAGARTKGLLLEGVTRNRITQVTRSSKPSLVVIGTPQRFGGPKFDWGDMARHFIAGAQCEVLMVALPGKPTIGAPVPKPKPKLKPQPST
jgi:nucleotide-binding universal stress UspA family protein